MKNIQVRLGSWAEMQQSASAIRYTVFVTEQGVDPREEYDPLDQRCIHALAVDCSGKAVGTGRLLEDGRIGRMAVLAEFRECGVGGAILEALVDAAIARGDHVSVLHAQEQAIPFYERHEFIVEGDLFYEANIPHRTMKRFHHH